MATMDMWSRPRAFSLIASSSLYTFSTSLYSSTRLCETVRFSANAYSSAALDRNVLSMCACVCVWRCRSSCEIGCVATSITCVCYML